MDRQSIIDGAIRADKQGNSAKYYIKKQLRNSYPRGQRMTARQRQQFENNFEVMWEEYWNATTADPHRQFGGRAGTTGGDFHKVWGREQTKDWHKDAPTHQVSDPLTTRSKHEVAHDVVKKLKEHASRLGWNGPDDWRRLSDIPAHKLDEQVEIIRRSVRPHVEGYDPTNTVKIEKALQAIPEKERKVWHQAIIRGQGKTDVPSQEIVSKNIKEAEEASKAASGYQPVSLDEWNKGPAGRAFRRFERDQAKRTRLAREAEKTLRERLHEVGDVKRIGGKPELTTLATSRATPEQEFAQEVLNSVMRGETKEFRDLPKNLQKVLDQPGYEKAKGFAKQLIEAALKHREKGGK